MTAVCGLCGEPMPAGEEMFKYHGYSGDCPKPPLATPERAVPENAFIKNAAFISDPTPERGTDAGEQTACKPVDLERLASALCEQYSRTDCSFPNCSCAQIEGGARRAKWLGDAKRVADFAGMIAGPVVMEAHLHAALEFLAAEDRIEAVAAVKALIEGRAP